MNKWYQSLDVAKKDMELVRPDGVKARLINARSPEII